MQTHQAIEPTSIPWHALIAGMSASLLGIGLARFSYTPLLPSLIAAHWFAAADVVYLGAANLAGYLVGAMLARRLGRQWGNRRTLQGMMLLASLAFFACAFPLSVAWFFSWRFLSGVAGGVIMVLVAATVLPHFPLHKRGIGSGAIFMGAGFGVAASGTLIPLLLQAGLQQTWLGLGVTAMILTAVSWTGWPDSGVPANPIAASQSAPKAGLLPLYLQYGLVALGLVPLMVFLVDFVARGLGEGAHVGSHFWVLFGLSASVGPLLYGMLADRIGFGLTLRVGLALQALMLAGLALTHSLLWVGLVSLMVGGFLTGVVPLVLGRVQETLAGDAAAQGAAWSRATTAFALFQALGGYGYSYLFNQSGGHYGALFAVGSTAFLLSLTIDLLAGVRLQRTYRATVPCAS
ncbi:MFS transporter [Chitinimonas naiadis]